MSLRRESLSKSRDLPIKQIFLVGRHEPDRKAVPTSPPTQPIRRRPIHNARGNPEEIADAIAPCDPLQVDALLDVIDRELMVPLACMRAAFESRLRHEDLSEMEAEFLERALDSIRSASVGAERIELAIREPRIQPLRCQVGEVAEIIRELLPSARRDKLELHYESEAWMFIDGPLLGRALTQVLESVMDRDSEAHVSLDLGSGKLLVTMRVFGSSNPWLDLGTRVGLRELRRMGAEVHPKVDPREWSLQITLPLESEEDSEVAA